jgi:hypothetical protein
MRCHGLSGKAKAAASNIEHSQEQLQCNASNQVTTPLINRHDGTWQDYPLLTCSSASSVCSACTLAATYMEHSQEHLQCNASNQATTPLINRHDGT